MSATAALASGCDVGAADDLDARVVADDGSPHENVRTLMPVSSASRSSAGIGAARA
jgi:hypothetical protein